MYPDPLILLSKDTRFQAEPPEGARVAERRNPACGDEIRLGLEIREDRIARLRYQVRACAVTRAAAAALGHCVEGLPLREARARAGAALDHLNGAADWTENWGRPELPALGEIRAFPMRLACARLPWEAFLAALPEE